MSEAFYLIHSTEIIKGSSLKETYANKLGKPEKKNGQISYQDSEAEIENLKRSV